MEISQRFLEKLAPLDTLVEVTDEQRLPLLHMPWEQVLRQKLPCKLAVLLLRNSSGHIYLKKKIISDIRRKRNVWGLDVTPVLAGEARLAAAFRMVQKLTGVKKIQPAEMARLSAPSAEHIEITYFQAAMPGDIPPMPVSETPLLLVDGDEIEGLLETAPEALAPEVHLIANTPCLFPRPE